MIQDSADHGVNVNARPHAHGQESVPAFPPASDANGQTIDIRRALKEGMANLRAASVPSHTLAAELLLMHALGRNRTWLYTHPEALLEPAGSEKYFELIARRAAGEPTQYLTGKQEFWGLEFEVTPAVLIPRPETEHVIEDALDPLPLRELRANRAQKTIGEGLQVGDIGTGSGCIAIALAKELPRAKFVATDISRAALEVARRNAARHQVADRVQFVESNLLHEASADFVGPRHPAHLLGKVVEAEKPVVATEKHPSPITGYRSPLFDLIASNPPYIARREAPTLAREVRDHE